MLILAIDSTATTASVALVKDSRVLGEVELDLGNKHSTTVLPCVEFLLREAGLRVEDVELFALTAGPGSFTGVRIGAATVKGLAFSTNAPVVGVSSLEVMARALSFVKGTVCPMINARHDRYFAAFFSSDGETVKRLTPDDVLTGDEISAFLAEKEAAYITGDGRELFLKCHDIHTEALPRCLVYPRASVAAELALQIYNSADVEERETFTAAALRPIYLRQPQAERELAERLAAASN